MLSLLLLIALFAYFNAKKAENFFDILVNSHQVTIVKLHEIDVQLEFSEKKLELYLNQPKQRHIILTQFIDRIEKKSSHYAAQHKISVLLRELTGALQNVVAHKKSPYTMQYSSSVAVIKLIEQFKFIATDDEYCIV